MIFEYLKEHRQELFHKGLISLLILFIISFFIVGMLFLTPVWPGFFALFVLNPLKFFFLFLGGLLFLSLLSAVGWLAIELKYASLKTTVKGDEVMSNEKIPLNIDCDPNDTLALSKLSQQANDTPENQVQKDNQEASSITLETYLKETKQFIFDLRIVILNRSFKMPGIFDGFEERFKALKKAYYQLARCYHPDKNRQGNEEQFKQIGHSYEEIGKIFERLKTLHNEEDVWETIRRMNESIENMNNNIAEFWKILSELKKDNEEMKKETQEMKKDTQEMKECNETLRRLIDENAVATLSSANREKLSSILASWEISQKPSNSDQTPTNATMATITPGFFSGIWQCGKNLFSKVTLVGSTTNNQQTVDASNVCEQISHTNNPSF